jgi:hypothetical protein
MNKTTKKVLIGIGIIGLAVGLYFGFRYISKKAKEERAKKSLEKLAKGSVPVYSDAKIATKAVFKPKKPTISVMSSFSSATGSYFSENKIKYSKYSDQPLLVGLEFYNMYKK